MTTWRGSQNYKLLPDVVRLTSFYLIHNTIKERLDLTKSPTSFGAKLIGERIAQMEKCHLVGTPASKNMIKEIVIWRVFQKDGNQCIS